MRLKFKYLIISVFYFQSIFLPAFASPEQDEEELKKLLVRRDSERGNIWTERSIRTIFERLKQHYQPLAETGDVDARISLGTWIAFVEDGEEGLGYILPHAHEGNSYAQYLAASCLVQMGYEPESMAWYALAAMQGDIPSMKLLTYYATRLNKPYAILELGRVYHAAGNYQEAANALERVVTNAQVNLNQTLAQGIIRELREDFCSAIGYYREAGDQGISYIEALFQNPHVLIIGLTGDAFKEDELIQVEDHLLTGLKQDPSLLTKLKECAQKSHHAAYVCGRYLLEKTSQLPGKNKKKKKKGRKNGRHVKSRTSGSRLLDEIVEANELLKFAAEKGHERAKQLVVKPQEKTSPPVIVATTPESVATEATKTPMEWLSEGHRLEKEKQTELALNAYEMAWAGKNTDACLPLGRLYFKKLQKGDEDACFELVELPLKSALKKGTAEACYYYGKLMAFKKDNDRAKEHWETALDKGSAKAAYRLGQFYLTVEEDKDKAVRYLAEAAHGGIYKSFLAYSIYLVAKNIEMGNATNNLYLGASKGHAPCLEKLVELATQNIPEGLLNLSVYYVDHKQISDARVFIERLDAISNHQFEKNVLHLKGRIAGIESKEEETISLYTAAAKMDFAPSWYQLGLIHVVKQQFKEAIDCFERAVAIEPNHILSYFQLGHLYLKQRNGLAIHNFTHAALLGSDEALRCLLNMHRSEPSPLVCVNIAQVYLNRGDYKTSRKFLENALKGEKEVKEVALFNMTQSYILENDVANAAKWARKAIDSGDHGIIDVLQKQAQAKDALDKTVARKILKKLNVPIAVVE